jgi:hypothetical protein
VATARAASLPLRFFRYNDGRALVEPRTGAIVDLLVSDEGIAAKIDLTPLAPVRRALTRAGLPAASLARALDEVAAASPARVYHLHYRQTPSSVREIAALTGREVRKLDLVEHRLPLILGGVAMTLLALGVVLPGRRTRSGVPPAQSRPSERDRSSLSTSAAKPPRSATEGSGVHTSTF